jgi:integrase
MKIEKVFRKDLKAYRWKIDLTVDGERIRRADFEKKKDALDAIAALRMKARTKRYGMVGSKPKITLGELQEKCDGTKTFWIFKHFVKIVGEKTGLASLTKADWQKYAHSLKGKKPTTINRYLSAVSTILHSASLQFPDLDSWSPPQAPWLPVSPGRARLLSKEELAKIFQALLAERQFGEKVSGPKYRREVYDLLRLMLLTGAREGELLNLKQNQVSWDWRTVRIESKKGGGSVRVVPLSDSALDILKSRIDHAPNFFLPITPWQLRAALQKASRLSGVAFGDKIDGGWVAHDLRHLAATVMENAGIPYSAVSAILGHKRKDQTATYAHAQLDTLRRGVEVLENHCREIDGFFAATTEKYLNMLTVGMQV